MKIINVNQRTNIISLGFICLLVGLIYITPQAQNAEPKFKVALPYILLSQENVAETFSELLELGFINEENKEIMDGIKRQISGDHNKQFYILGNEVSENIIIGKDEFVITDKAFKQLVDNLSKLVEQYLAQGIEIKLLDSGAKLYDNKFRYNFLKVYTPYANRFSYQYYFNFIQQSYSITINSSKDDIEIEDLISIDY